MSDTKAKKPAKPKAVAAHPPYAQMIVKAIAALKERNGSSKAAIVKYIMANFKVGSDDKQISKFVRSGLKKGVTKGSLKQTKGTGASGSFKVGEKPKAAKPKKAAKKPKASKPKSPKKAKKPAAAKAKKPAAKKAKKPAAKKTDAKKAKPAAKKPKASKPKSPKKVKKTAAKKPAAKKVAKK